MIGVKLKTEALRLKAFYPERHDAPGDETANRANGPPTLAEELDDDPPSTPSRFEGNQPD